MPTLNAQVVYQGLTIKYHTSKPPSPVQQVKLHGSYQLAKAMLDKVISEITEIRAAIKRNPFANSVSPLTRTILVHHFHLAEGKDKAAMEQLSTDLGKILGVYRATSNGLNGPTTISDAYSDVLKQAALGNVVTADRGYVGKRHDHSKPQIAPGKFPLFAANLPNNKYSAAGLGSIHIDFDLLTTDSKLSIARTIIHESTHKYKDTEDHAYAWYHQSNVNGTPYNQLTKAEAIDNADSFAYAAVCIYKKKLLTGPINTLS
jgi:hypothetical protein